MPVKIRLTRMGKKKQPSYRVVVVDSRKPRDGAYIEQIGFYDPRQEPSLVKINNERALSWLNEGAQPTERAQKLLEISGAWTRFRVQTGDIHTVGEAPEAAPPAPPAAPEPQSEPAVAIEAVAIEAVAIEVDAGEPEADSAPADEATAQQGTDEATAEQEDVS